MGPNSWVPENPGDYWHGESSQLKWCAGRQWGTTNNEEFVDGVQFQTDKSCEDQGLEFVPFHKVCPSYPCTGSAHYTQNGKTVTFTEDKVWWPRHCYPCVQDPLKEGGNGLVVQYKRCPQLLSTLGAAQGYMAMIELGVSLLVLFLLYMCGVINTERSYLNIWVVDLIKEAQGEEVQVSTPADQKDEDSNEAVSVPLSPKQRRNNGTSTASERLPHVWALSSTRCE